MSAKVTSMFLLAILVGSSEQFAQAQAWGNLTGQFIDTTIPSPPKKFNVDKDPQVCAVNNPVDESLVVGAKGELANIVIMLKTKDKLAVNPAAAKAPAEVTIDKAGSTAHLEYPGE